LHGSGILLRSRLQRRRDQRADASYPAVAAFAFRRYNGLAVNRISAPFRIEKDQSIVSFRTTIYNHRIEVPAMEELPDGTEVMVQLVPVNQPIGLNESDWDDTPEGIADWINWLDSLEPLTFTEQECAALEADRLARKQWEQGAFSERADRLAGDWK
jgi:hypothetical protein